MVRKAARQLYSPFLRNPSIPLSRKGQVMQSLILARGLHLGGCWPIMLPREARTVKRAIVDMLRPLLGEFKVDKRPSDDDVIKSLGVLHPVRLLTLMRVQTAIRVATKAPLQVLLLIFEARESRRSWLRALELDLEHLSRAPVLHYFAGASIAKWFQFFRDFPKQAKQAVMKAIRITNWVTQEEREAERVSTTYCVLCGVEALDRQALSVHCFRAHGVRRFIRSYVEGLDCLVCGLRFASRQRLVDHLSEKSPVCSHNYILRYSPLPPEQVQHMDVDARSEPSRRLRLEGAHGVRIHGPFLQVINLEGESIRSRHPLGPNRRWSG